MGSRVNDGRSFRKIPVSHQGIRSEEIGILNLRGLVRKLIAGT
ncbi:MAG: hypothetical protein Q8S54_06650 [Bacteroidota bacterium]|nr:hypothetical protein [Bacteroidota bacterium]